MSMNDVVQEWLRSGQCAKLDGINLKPRPHPSLPGDPLVTIRGQAAAYYLEDSNGGRRILKKFLPGRNPDAQYISSVKALVPRENGFESGYERTVLFSSSVLSPGYSSAEFAAWVDNTILMHMVSGCDWANLADSIRDGTQSLTPDQRLSLCLSLSEKIRLLEDSDLSHRDLSSTNVFIDLQNLEAHLIDWDSLYHPSLNMPANTTFGTQGYIAPFVKVNGTEDPQVTWRARSDRFSLAIVNAEILSMDIGSPLSGDGGAFEQDEIYNRGGRRTDEILKVVRDNHPKAAALVEQSLNATDFDGCPGPDEWIVALGGKGRSLSAAAASLGDGRKFVRLNKAAFVKFNTTLLIKPPTV